MESKKAKTDKVIKKHSFITLISLVLIIGFHIVLYVDFFKKEHEKLHSEGLKTKTIVLDKFLKGVGKSAKMRMHIYYEFSYRNRTYKQTKENDFFNIGDTLELIFHPKNPDNHEILNMNE